MEIGIHEFLATNTFAYAYVCVCIRLLMHTFACYATYLTALAKITDLFVFQSGITCHISILCIDLINTYLGLRVVYIS